MKIPPLFFFVLLAVSGSAQVLDVNGDALVGPEEAYRLSDDWKGSAIAPNGHDHLNQTWRPTGTGRPLSIRGNFPDRTIIIGPVKDGEKGLSAIPSAPLILDNTVSNGSDLLLGGILGIIRAVEQPSSSLVLRSNESVVVFLNEDGVGNAGGFNVRNRNGDLQGSISSLGNLFVGGDGLIEGNLDVNGTITMGKGNLAFPREFPEKDEPQHYVAVAGPVAMDVYCGKVELDSEGRAQVPLPTGVGGLYSDFLYQLTPLGKPAPELFVAAEIKEDRFAVAGGPPGLTVSWQVTGIAPKP